MTAKYRGRTRWLYTAVFALVLAMAAGAFAGGHAYAGRLTDTPAGLNTQPAKVSARPLAPLVGEVTLTATGGTPTGSYTTLKEAFDAINAGTHQGDIAISIREIGTDISTFSERYHLSRRESQVAELVLRGHRNSQIAAALGITPATTKKHLSRIFEKVGVDSRALLVGKLA